MTDWLRKHLELELNAAKSGVWRPEDTPLLGFRIHASGDVSPAPKVLGRYKNRVGSLWDDRQSLTSTHPRDQW